MANIPPRPAAPRPQLPTPAAVVPPTTTPVGNTAAPVVAAPTTPVAPVADVAPTIPTGTAPVVNTEATTQAAAASTAGKRKGRAPRQLTTYWGVIQYDDQGNAKTVTKNVEQADKTVVAVTEPLRQQLDAPPVLFTGTEAEAKAGVLNSKAEDNGFNVEKHEGLERSDFKKVSDYERHRSNLMLQKSKWLLDEAAAIDAGTSTKGQTATRQLEEMKSGMAKLMELLQAQGISAEAIAAKLQS